MIMESSILGFLNDSSLSFLLNEYLKELRFGVLHKCSDDAIIKRLTEVGHGIKKVYMDLDFVNQQRSPSFVKQVVSLLPNINVLHLLWICEDDTLQVISLSCPNLEELYIDESHVTDEGMKNLCSVKEDSTQAKCFLKSLSLKNTDVGTTGLTYLLANMPSLEVLIHKDVPAILYSMHKDDLINNALISTRKYNLTTLDFVNCNLHTWNLTNVLKICIEICPHLKKLCIPLTDDEQLNLISQFSELENLLLYFTSMKKPYVEFNEFLALRGEQLKEMHLSNTSFSASTLLLNCSKLEYLKLRDVSFQYDEQKDLNTKHKLNKLRELRLENFGFAEHSVEMSVGSILNSSPKLESLILSHCELGESNMNTKIANFCAKNEVKTLSFSYTDVQSSFLEKLILGCPSLETLAIQECDLIHSSDISNLYDISNSKKTKVHIIWSDDDGSEFNSVDDYSDYDFHDSDHEYYDYEDYHDDYEDYHDPYDSDDVYDLFIV